MRKSDELRRWVAVVGLFDDDDRGSSNIRLLHDSCGALCYVPWHPALGTSRGLGELSVIEIDVLSADHQATGVEGVAGPEYCTDVAIPSHAVEDDRHWPAWQVLEALTPWFAAPEFALEELTPSRLARWRIKSLRALHRFTVIGANGRHPGH